MKFQNIEMFLQVVFWNGRVMLQYLTPASIISNNLKAGSNL